MSGAAERLVDRLVEAAVTRAVLESRGALRVLGGSTLLGAIGAFFPLTTAKVLAQEVRGALEKKQLRIGFVPVACAAPLLIADPMRFYALQGLDVVLVKTPGWALVRDLVSNEKFDAAHMLAPMPLALTLGLGSPAQPMHVAAIANVNGQALTLHLRHRNRRDPLQWKGMRFGVPFEYSMQNLLLRSYLAVHGLDPDRDVAIRIVPPFEMVGQLRAGGLDGFLGPEPFNQRAVYDGIGFIHVLSKDLWDGHPCCAVGLPARFVKENPNTFAALFRALAFATAYAQRPENRRDIAEAIAPAPWLDQPLPVVEQVLTGRFPDGLGNQLNVPTRAAFEPFPWHSMAVWILAQLKRWGYLQQDVDFHQVAEQVFLATEARKRLSDLGLAAPERTYAQHRVSGRIFDPAQPGDSRGSVPPVRGSQAA